MVKGDYVKTPRFLNVSISEVFDSEDEARAEGFTEPTHYEGEGFGILGKSLDMYSMVFAGYKK